MFYDVGVSPGLPNEMVALFSEWTLRMYERKKCNNVDDARLELDGNMLPPCTRVILQVKRKKLYKMAINK